MPAARSSTQLWGVSGDWELTVAPFDATPSWRPSESFARQLSEIVEHARGNAWLLRQFLDDHPTRWLGYDISDDDVISALAEGLSRGLFELREHPRDDLRAPHVEPDEIDRRKGPHAPLEPRSRPISDIDRGREQQQEEPTLLRLELGAFGFDSMGVLVLPRAAAGRWHPWAAMTVLARHLQANAGSRFVALGHQEAGEPAGHSERRATALVHFVRDEKTQWIAIAAKWGRVRDTQEFLGYLQHAQGWPIPAPAVTDAADGPTAAAVEAFQRNYNERFKSGVPIFEDGVIGEETLGAIFDVARADLSQWLGARGTSYDALLFFDDGRRTLACEDRFKPYRTMPALPAHQGGRFIDLVIVPPDVAPKIDLAKAPAGAGIYDVAAIHTLPLGGVAPPKTGLVLEIVLRDDRDTPRAGAQFEVLLADGTVRRGVLDGFGEAHLDGLVEGPCSVRFPELSPGSWFLEGTTPL